MIHDGIILGKTGAMVYVMDENGNQLTSGAHRVTWSGHDEIRTKTGASTGSEKIDTSAIDVSGVVNNRLARQITLDDIVQGAADERIRVFAEYLKKLDNGELS